METNLNACVADAAANVYQGKTFVLLSESEIYVCADP